MDCEHASTTTLLWLYGEAGDEHLAHLESCAACRGVVAEHADVAAALGPSLAALQAQQRATEAPRQSWRGLGAIVTTVVALAAVWLAFVLAPGAPEVPPVAEALIYDEGLSAAIAASGGPLANADSFDVQLDDLDLELDRLSRDLEML